VVLGLLGQTALHMLVAVAVVNLEPAIQALFHQPLVALAAAEMAVIAQAALLGTEFLALQIPAVEAAAVAITPHQTGVVADQEL